MQGNRIAHYPSLKDASEATGISANATGLVIRNIYKSGKGYYWKKGYGKEAAMSMGVGAFNIIAACRDYQKTCCGNG